MSSKYFLIVKNDLRYPRNFGWSELWLWILTVLDVRTEQDFIVIYLITIMIIKSFNVSINNMFVKITTFSKTERKRVRAVPL